MINNPLSKWGVVFLSRDMNQFIIIMHNTELFGFFFFS